MATILTAPNQTELGCGHCQDTTVIVDVDKPAVSLAGYVLLTAWDDNGPYVFLGRCFYCNHRDR